MTSKLIKALQIFLKYGDIPTPTECEDGNLYVLYDPSCISDEDKSLLADLGFVPDRIINCFVSDIYGGLGEPEPDND